MATPQIYVSSKDRPENFRVTVCDPCEGIYVVRNPPRGHMVKCPSCGRTSRRITAGELGDGTEMGLISEFLRG